MVECLLPTCVRSYYTRIKKDRFGYPIKPRDPELEEPARAVKNLISKAPLPAQVRPIIHPDHKTFTGTERYQQLIIDKISEAFTARTPPNVNNTVSAVFYQEGMKRVGLIGRKLGETKTFLRTGEVKQSTMIEIPTNHVLECSQSLNTRVLDGKGVKIRLGAFDQPDLTEVPLTKQKEFMSLGLVPQRAEYIFLTSPELALPVHFQLDISHFLVGQFVDITAQSVPRGFQGVIRRHGYKGMNMNRPGKTHRRPGSISTQGLKRVLRGKKLAGMMGDNRSTAYNNHVLSVDYGKGLMVVGGHIPGMVGSFCYLRDSREKDPIQGPLLHSPTFLGDREALRSQGIRYDAKVVDPSETFEEVMANKITTPNWYM